MGETMTSEQRAAVAVHNATQNRMCLNLSGNGQICVACSEVADQIDSAVEVERQRSQKAIAAAQRKCKLYRDALLSIQINTDDAVAHKTAEIALAAPAAGEEKSNV